MPKTPTELTTEAKALHSQACELFDLAHSRIRSVGGPAENDPVKFGLAHLSGAVEKLLEAVERHQQLHESK